MLTCLPILARPCAHSRLPAFWCGAAAASLLLVCLLFSGHSHSFTPPATEYPPAFFPLHAARPTYLQALPGVGCISEVRASGPAVRAAVAVWPGEAFADAALAAAVPDIRTLRGLPDPERAAQ